MSDLKEFRVLKDVINPKYIDDLFATFFQVSNLFANDELLQQSKPHDWSDLKFNLSLINLRKNEKEKFSSIYDNFQNGLYIYNFLYKNKLDKIVYKFLNAKESEVTLYNAYLRMDPPIDNRNSLDWHVDVSKNKFKIAKAVGVVVASEILKKYINKVPGLEPTIKDVDGDEIMNLSNEILQQNVSLKIMGIDRYIDTKIDNE